MPMRTILILASVVLPAAANAQSLHLICAGGGAASKPQADRVYSVGPYGESAGATVVTRRDSPFSDSVNVEISGQSGRIRLPRTMLPPIHGGSEGWFELTDLRVGEHVITASAKVNFMNRPKVRIDRLTGAISIDGKVGQFSGQCSAYDPAAVRRRF